MNNTVVGYIASHPFWDGAYLPQRVQNTLVRSYCETNRLSLLWSIPEVSIGYQKTPALTNFLRDARRKEIDSVVFISYQMNTPKTIIRCLREIIELSISAHFAIENCTVETPQDLIKIEPEIILSRLNLMQQESPLSMQNNS